MSDGNRAKRNRRIRVLIGEMVEPLQPGQTIRTEKILADLQARDRRWGIDAHQIGNMVREREDLDHVGNNTWQKVKA
jgi:hypothetical protein